MKTSRRSFLISMLAASAAMGGGLIMGGTSTAFAAETPAGETLVIFYSWSGNTRDIAGRIHQKVGGDLVELELARPYSSNYNSCLDEAKRDMEQGNRPELKTRIANLEKYKTVFLGYPNWWATIPAPIASLLEQYDFSG